MINSKTFNVLVFVLAAVCAATTIPEHLLCCSADAGTFQNLDGGNLSCWHQASNKTTRVSISCTLYAVLSENDINYTITDSGRVFFETASPIGTSSIEVKTEEICFANDTDSNTNETTRAIVLCQEEEEDESVLGYCMLVSAIFLFITMAIYAALPEIRDLQGKSIINFCGSMGVGLAILYYNKVISYSDMAWCAVRGFLIYFFLITSFFWTNAISIQMLLSLRRPLVNNYGWSEFLWYALYAWGCPTVLTVAMAIVNFHPGNHVKPGIGLNHCWFFNTALQWQYMYSVMTILIVVNICIFIYTSVRLWRHSFSSSHLKALRYKFLMSLRMFTIMGITWIFEMISSLSPQSVVWSIIDLFNALQGPLIFLLLVVFRKRVVKALLKRGYLDCISGPVERYLALREDDEEGVIEHTIDVTMNERNGTEKSRL